jgi:hypothetical protein
VVTLLLVLELDSFFIMPHVGPGQILIKTEYTLKKNFFREMDMVPTATIS